MARGFQQGVRPSIVFSSGVCHPCPPRHRPTAQDFLPPFSYHGVVATYNAQGARVFLMPAVYNAALGFKAAADAKAPTAPVGSPANAAPATAALAWPKGQGIAAKGLPEDDDYYETFLEEARDLDVPGPGLEEGGEQVEAGRVDVPPQWAQRQPKEDGGDEAEQDEER
jgi:hypothetical protein